MNSDNIALKIVEFRKKLGWSQKRLAKEIGSPNATINIIESRNTKPKIDTVEKIAAAFKITVSQLLGEDKIDDHEKMEFFSKWGKINMLSHNDKEIINRLIIRLINK